VNCLKIFRFDKFGNMDYDVQSLQLAVKIFKEMQQGEFDEIQIRKIEKQKERQKQNQKNLGERSWKTARICQRLLRSPKK